MSEERLTDEERQLLVTALTIGLVNGMTRAKDAADVHAFMTLHALLKKLEGVDKVVVVRRP